MSDLEELRHSLTTTHWLSRWANYKWWARWAFVFLVFGVLFEVCAASSKLAQPGKSETKSTTAT